MQILNTANLLRPACIAGLLLSTAALLQAQVIPSERAFTNGWRHAGRTAPIPEPSRILNVRDYGAQGLGLTNEQTAIQNAINALGTAGGVVYFPAGTYIISSSLSLRSGAVLRGERSHNTEILITNVPASGVHGINIIDNNQPTIWTDIESGYDLHSDTVALTNVSPFTAGDWVETRQGTNSAWKMSSWPDMIGQILRVAEVTTTVPPGGTLRFETPLRLQYTPGLPLNGTPVPVQIRRLTPIRDVGIENLRIGRTVAGTATTRNNTYSIYFRYAVNCWVRGCVFTNVFGAAIGADYSANITISGNYIHDAYEYDGGGSGYGVVLTYKVSELLVENNVFRRLRHAMLVQAGVNGNVFGYNYSHEPNSDDHGSNASDIAIHGNYPYANLFEGNIVKHIQIDASHGVNGPHNLFFRNRAERNGFNMTQSQSHGQSVVGNELFRSNDFWFRSFTGDGYRFQGTNHFAYGNNHTNAIKPSGSAELADISYYMGTCVTNVPLPGWWNIPQTLPVHGPRANGSYPLLNDVRDIPARARWFAGGTLTYAPPSLYRQPTNRVVNQGETAIFEIGAAGTPEIRVQWFRDGALLPDGTNAALAIAPADLPDAGVYHAEISDDGGMARSAAATLTVQRVSFPLTATAGANGTIDPSGAFQVDYGTVSVFRVAADTDYYIAAVLINGEPVAGAAGQLEYELVWGPAYHSATVTAAFAQNLVTSHGVPHAWLAQYDDTIADFESAAELDADGDGHSNWQEYLAGTCPTNPASVLRITASHVAPGTDSGQDRTLFWLSATGKSYSIWWSTNLAVQPEPLATNLAADPPTNQYTHANVPPVPAFYRVMLE